MITKEGLLGKGGGLIESFRKGKAELFLNQVRCGGNEKFVSIGGSNTCREKEGENVTFSEFCKEFIVLL